jgi:hypothetical protein
MLMLLRGGEMKSAEVSVIVACFVGSCAYGQSATPTISVKPNALEYSTPQLVQDIEAAPALAGPYGCDGDGSIYAWINGYIFAGGNSNPDRLALVGIHPDGTVTNFSGHSVTGPNGTSSFPKSFFVGDDHVYLLVDTPVSAGGGSHTQSVLVLDKRGGLNRAITLESNIHPLVFGVFRSGKILAVSEDSSSHRMAFRLIDGNGAFIREIQLKDSDFILGTSELIPDSHTTVNYSPALLISMIKVIALGEHLLLVPIGTSNRPILELDENGIVGSVIPQLPDHMVLESFISSDESSFMVQLGRLLESTKKSVDSQGRVLGIATAPRHLITEISRKDGSIVRELELKEPDLLPLCQTDSVFHILAAPSEGRLQVLTAESRCRQYVQNPCD